MWEEKAMFETLGLEIFTRDERDRVMTENVRPGC
jgi:hypothetical protein